MTTTTHHDHGGEPVEDFSTGEGLCALLNRLHEAGEGAWASDPAARELMAYAAQKYTPLARKHGLDPWALVTHGVRITCIFEERAQGLLCSVHQAR